MAKLEYRCHWNETGSTLRKPARTKVTNMHRLRKSLPWFGRLLMTAGLMFVIYKLWIYHEVLEQKWIEPLLWSWVILFSIVYGVSELLLSYGWFLLLRSQDAGSQSLSWKELWPVYGKTQIAKYIPGNVFHIAGRHVIVHKSGVAHADLLTAAISEIILMLTSALLISLFAAGGIINKFGESLSSGLIILFIGGGMLFVLALSRPGAVKILKRMNRRRVAASQIAYFSFFVSSCLLFLATIALTSETQSAIATNWPAICGGYAFSWAVGFITPGAPGGLGVREAMLIALLGFILPEAELVFGMFFFRIINTSGDLVFYLLAVIAEKTFQKSITIMK